MESSRAVARFVRVSPRKARLAVDLVRGKDLVEAQRILEYTPRAAARVVAKVLGSAAANAESNTPLSPEELFVARAYVDEGPTLKRFRPRALGRATRINKRTSHITIILEEKEPEVTVTKRRRFRRSRPSADGEKADKAEKEKTGEEPEEESEGKKESEPAGKAKSAKKPAAKKAAKKAAEGTKKPPAKKAAKSAKKPPAKKAAKKKSTKSAGAGKHKKAAKKKSGESKPEGKKGED